MEFKLSLVNYLAMFVAAIFLLGGLVSIPSSTLANPSPTPTITPESTPLPSPSPDVISCQAQYNDAVGLFSILHDTVYLIDSNHTDLVGDVDLLEFWIEGWETENAGEEAEQDEALGHIVSAALKLAEAQPHVVSIQDSLETIEDYWVDIQNVELEEAMCVSILESIEALDDVDQQISSKVYLIDGPHYDARDFLDQANAIYPYELY